MSTVTWKGIVKNFYFQLQIDLSPDNPEKHDYLLLEAPGRYRKLLKSSEGKNVKVILRIDD